MPPSQTLQKALPQDNKLYQVYWAGEVLVPKAEEATPRFCLWLHEINEFGISVYPGFVREVVESVGAIPKYPIGSYWRAGRLSSPKGIGPPGPVTLEIVAPDVWAVVRAGDFRPLDERSRPRRWIDQPDLELAMKTSHRQVKGYDAWVVYARTTDGRDVIIPCYEIFRAFYGATTDLSLSLLSGTWESVERNFIIDGRRRDDDQGTHLELDLPSGVPESAVPHLCLLHFVERARKVANKIYSATVRQAQSGDPVWLAAIPPITGRTFRLRAKVERLRTSNAILVTQIFGSDFPIQVTDVRYSIPIRTIPVETQTKTEPEPLERRLQSNVSTIVSKPADAKATRRNSQLSSSAVSFLGFPPPHQSARMEREMPIQGSLPLGPGTISNVSVGTPSGTAVLTRAQFAPDEEAIIQDRFKAIFELVEALIEEGRIQSVREYPLVNPVPAMSPRYCEFSPVTKGGTDCRWTTVRAPSLRQRRALVLELSVNDRLIYWIESEAPDPRRGNCALAVELVKGGTLDEGTLSALLDTCAINKGVWPQPLPFGKGIIVSARARHLAATNKEHYRKNVMLLAFSRLTKAKTEIEHLEQTSRVGV
jgi:hypothetical protein